MEPSTSTIARVVLRPKEEGRILRGHQWIFSNEIALVEGEVQNGDFVAVYSHSNYLIGCGFYNKNSLIAVRLFTRTIDFDVEALFSEKLKNAFGLRKTLFPDSGSFRFVFSESDFLPGLIIDKYNDTYVLQINSAGMESHKAIIASILQNEYHAKNIFTMHDEYFRRMEGLLPDNEILLGEKGIEIISDGDVRFKIDFDSTQKTGFFFDQVANRKYVGQFAAGKTILDAYCNSGGFGLHALRAGASHVTFVDSSRSEIQNVDENLRQNAMLNDEQYSLVCEDVFIYLEQCIAEKKLFDIVLIDPPAFAKNKKSVKTALKGYEKLHRLALSTVRPGGFLVSTSCSHHVTKEEYLQVASQAAYKLNVSIQLLYSAGASPDHPVLLNMPETEYLKFVVYRKY
jgi:23S rRNA (cytosine1962-C5)-methyltransferase